MGLQVNLSRGLIIPRLMKAFCIEKGQVVGDAAPGLAGRSVVLQIDIFVLEGPPEPFVEDVVERLPATTATQLFKPQGSHTEEDCAQD